MLPVWFKTKSQHYLRSHLRDKHDRITEISGNKLSKQGSLDTHVEEGAFADLEEKDDAFDGLLELDDTPKVIGHDDEDLFTDWNLLDKQKWTEPILKSENENINYKTMDSFRVLKRRTTAQC